MSLNVLQYARECAKHSDVSSTARVLLITLSTYAVKSGEAFPSMAELTTVTGMSRSTIWRAGVELEEAGIVTVKRRRRFPTLFSFPVDKFEIGRVDATYDDALGRGMSRGRDISSRVGATRKEKGKDKESGASFCESTCPECQGTNYVRPHEGARFVVPCPSQSAEALEEVRAR